MVRISESQNLQIFWNFSRNFHTISARFESSGILYHNIRPGGGRAFWNMGGGGGGEGLIDKPRLFLYSYFPNVIHCSFSQTNFFAMSLVFHVFVIDLQQGSSRQLFRWSFFIVFMVFLRYVFSLRRAVNVCWEVTDAISYAKYNLNSLWTPPRSVLVTSFVESLAKLLYL